MRPVSFSSVRVRSLAIALAIASLANASTAQDTSDSAIRLSPFVVSSDRSAEPEIAERNRAGYALVPISSGGSVAIDDLADSLANYPGYSAFRSAPARVAHPTTQGIRLRNLGINATSRTLVTLDGVPQNDPFGGWVYWQRYNPSTIAETEIRPSSDSEAWGNYGTGGRISLKSLTTGQNRFRSKATLGTDGKQAASFASETALSNQASISLSALASEFDGFYVVSPGQRGSIDRKANSEVSAYQGQFNFAASERLEISIKGDHYSEDRVNGTPGSLNGTNATDFAASALQYFDAGRSGIQLLAYAQDRDFHNVFTSVAEDRNSERPVLDQYSMPAEAHGASASYFSKLANDSELRFGIDFRDVEGEVNERFRNLGAGFTRLRQAGGEQRVQGAFANGSFPLAESTWLAATIRSDEVKNRSGFRSEWNTETDAQIRNDRFDDSDETFFSHDLSLFHEFSDAIHGSLKHSSGFRTPTLNELYRPFRVKNDITEANPGLVAEEHQGFEAGIGFNDSDLWSLNAYWFHYDLDNMIANVVLSRESGFNPLCGFVPGGGSCGQRLNVPNSQVEGFELAWQANPTEWFSILLQLVYADSEVSTSNAYPELSYFEFPHAAPFRSTLSLQWKPTDEVMVWTDIRHRDDEFEDLENQRRLSGSTTADIGVRYAIAGEHTLSLRVDNAFDVEMETGLSSSGLLSIGAPRTLWVSWEFAR